jgi:hypothetical protein
MDALGDSSDDGAVNRANDARTTHGGGAEAAATEATLRTVAGGRCRQREGGVGGAAGMGRMRCASSSMARGRDSGENPRGRDGRRAGSGSGAGRYLGARRSRVCDVLEPENSPAWGIERSPDPREPGKSGSN